ncbi:transglutaminase domain-containing protein [Candidatus Woesearchaeota archaeon]|jgi:transglutaminase-like putative cysteine protease|nr:transglutaminase domain-containing protein [Candidatus Woesearchaeota archaeon]MBT3537575.1 transglutaminase domain-containing protein [Candidatus Woesearchaeota archaeon]MBT4697415.1 transglutaminase domain-containing protein [Candidatus Woesearchaeota archaeon]MBT7105244.1 transglutaminase domain-containing protein [Candidatus Woesearchaeota archaeon]MBT7930507.1 transglutaminase domain-containing protein [Candidatus Woesearchaeota archaeon]
MKKVMLLILMIFIILPAIAAQDSSWLYNTESFLIENSISSEMTVKPSSSNYYLKNVFVNLSFIPKNTWQQEILSIKADPQGVNFGDSYIFQWNNPDQQMSYSLTSVIEAKNRIKKVTSKVQYPLTDLPEDTHKYLEPSTNIDSDHPVVKKTANQLIGDKNDLYEVLFTLAEWVNKNINYSLDTLSLEASERSSVVLNTRRGVCDELTNLFIGLCRASGIPARFVSGISYTNSQLFDDSWGLHGWSEVYFPRYGWIPFDVTYAEFGWINPLHITCKIGVDSSESTTEFEWQGKNVNLEVTEPAIQTKIIERKGEVKNPLAIKTKVLEKAVGFGSYNLAVIELTNTEDYYSPVTISIAKTTLLEYFDDFTKHILLKPKETKHIFWKVRISDTLDRRKIYNFPITIYDQFNRTSKVSFSASFDDRLFTERYVESHATQESIVEEDSIEFKCEVQDEFYYNYEEIKAECTINNKENKRYASVSVCFENECTKTSINENEKKTIKLKNQITTLGVQELMFSLRGESINKKDYIQSYIADKPEIIVNEIKVPKKVDFNQYYDVSFIVEKHSTSNPQDVNLIIQQNGDFEEFHTPILDGDQKFTLSFSSMGLKDGDNVGRISISFKDKKGNQYTEDLTFNTWLNKLSFWQKIRRWLYKSDKFIVAQFKATQSFIKRQS